MPPRPGAVAIAAMGEVSSFIAAIVNYLLHAPRPRPCCADKKKARGGTGFSKDGPDFTWLAARSCC
jgi:hypothetical protein